MVSFGGEDKRPHVGFQTLLRQEWTDNKRVREERLSLMSDLDKKSGVCVARGVSLM